MCLPIRVLFIIQSSVSMLFNLEKEITQQSLVNSWYETTDKTALSLGNVWQSYMEFITVKNLISPVNRNYNVITNLTE